MVVSYNLLQQFFFLTSLNLYFRKFIQKNVLLYLPIPDKLFKQN